MKAVFYFQSIRFEQTHPYSHTSLCNYDLIRVHDLLMSCKLSLGYLFIYFCTCPYWNSSAALPHLQGPVKYSNSSFSIVFRQLLHWHLHTQLFNLVSWSFFPPNHLWNMFALHLLQQIFSCLWFCFLIIPLTMTKKVLNSIIA